MVYIVRQTPLNNLPFPICVYTDVASSCMETIGTYQNYYVPGNLIGINLSDNIGGNPFVPYVPEVAVPEYIPGVTPLVPYGVPGYQDPYGLLVLVQTSDGELFYAYERERWRGRRVTTIFIVDSTFDPYRISSGIGGGFCNYRGFRNGYGVL